MHLIHTTFSNSMEKKDEYIQDASAPFLKLLELTNVHIIWISSSDVM